MSWCDYICLPVDVLKQILVGYGFRDFTVHLDVCVFNYGSVDMLTLTSACISVEVVIYLLDPRVKCLNSFA